MVGPVPVQEKLFTTRYKRCRSPIDNVYVDGDKMAVVPGGVVFVSSDITLGKLLMYCDYGSSPTDTHELIASRSNVRFDDIRGVAFTGSLVVIAAEGNLECDLGELGIYGFCWQDLLKGRVEPIRLHVYQSAMDAHGPIVHWGSMAGATNSLAILGTTVLKTMSGFDNEDDQYEPEWIDTLGPVGKPSLVAVSSAQPQMLAVAGGNQLAVSLFDSPEKLRSNIGTLPGSPRCLTISDNGQMIALGYSTGLVQIWDSRNIDKPIVSTNELESECCSVTFSGSASDRLFAAAKNSSEVLVIDTRFFSEHQKIWLPAIPRPSETLSRYDLRTALWPDSKNVYELPTSRPDNFIATLTVSDICWLDEDDGVLAVGTSEGILFIQCGQRTPPKSVEWM